MKPKFIISLLLILSLLFVVQCASEAAPGGGPPDKTPPVLINMNVASGSTLIPVDQEIIFFFSENLNPDNIKKNVTVFPVSDKPVIVRVRGKNLSVYPPETWDPDIVYTLIVGKGVSDIRGNNLEQPIQLSFTSGNTIPKNTIGGKVLGLTKGTTAVISLSRNSDNPDSIIQYPEYYTQTGPDGDFWFEYLPAEQFHIAGYIDLDKSNSYKDKFDGVCIPSDPAPVADTAFSPILVEAVYENYLRGFVIKAESMDPSKTVVGFSKNIAPWNGTSNIDMGSLSIDTVLIENAACTIYHEEVTADTFTLAITGLLDNVNKSIADSLMYIPVTNWPDSFFHFEQIGNLLRITPDPKADKLDAVLQGTDTSDIVLKKRIPGFYELPQLKTARNGKCLLTLPFINERTVSDSLYSFQLNIGPLPEYGAVLGKIESGGYHDLHVILQNDKNDYDIPVTDQAFSFTKVLPGTYVLSYYFDMNGNARRDPGQPYPYIEPEFLFPLDKDIEVRARWDTELADPYKIVIENGK